MSISDDPFQLQRFITAQEGVYDQVLTELRNGRKQTHWMWYIFPQIAGLGFSTTSKFYAIQSIDEAQAYLQHSKLGQGLIECTRTVLAIEGRPAHDIFGSPDDVKFRSCMTLFEFIAGADSVFAQALDKFYAGERDNRTLQLLQKV